MWHAWDCSRRHFFLKLGNMKDSQKTLSSLASGSVCLSIYNYTVLRIHGAFKRVTGKVQPKDECRGTFENAQASNLNLSSGQTDECN